MRAVAAYVRLSKSLFYTWGAGPFILSKVGLSTASRGGGEITVLFCLVVYRLMIL